MLTNAQALDAVERQLQLVPEDMLCWNRFSAVFLADARETHGAYDTITVWRVPSFILDASKDDVPRLKERSTQGYYRFSVTKCTRAHLHLDTWSSAAVTPLPEQLRT